MITFAVYEVLTRLFWVAVLSIPTCLAALLVCRLQSVHPGVKVWALRLAGIKIAADLVFGLSWGWRVLPEGWVDPGSKVSQGIALPNFIPALLVSALGYWMSVQLIRLAKAAWTARQVMRGSLELSLPYAATRGVKVVFSGSIDCPAAVGLLRPRIVLPSGEPRPDAIEVAHEAAHIRHGDLWAQAGFAVLHAVLGFLPWVARVEREAALWQEVWADHSAHQVTGAPKKEHAQRILLRMNQAAPVWTASMAGTKEGAERRLRALYVSRHSLAAALICLILVGLTTLPVRAALSDIADARLVSPVQRTFAPASAPGGTAPIAAPVGGG